MKSLFVSFIYNKSGTEKREVTFNNTVIDVANELMEITDAQSVKEVENLIMHQMDLIEPPLIIYYKWLPKE